MDIRKTSSECCNAKFMLLEQRVTDLKQSRATAEKQLICSPTPLELTDPGLRGCVLVLGSSQNRV